MIDIAEALTQARYVVDSEGERTGVLLPVKTWKELLATWKELIDLIEDQQDAAILHEWIAQRAAGAVETMSLDELERELQADGLLPG
jgi:hypothetical protein